MKLPKNLFFLAALLIVPSVSSADSVTLVTSRDTTIYQGNPGNSNGAGQVMFVGNTGQGTATRALLGFDIAGNVPAGSTITNVQLQLVLDRAAAFEFNTRGVLLVRLLADWGEGTAGQGSDGSGSGAGFGTPANGTAATWSHRFYNTVPWAQAGGDFAQTASGSTVVGITSMAYVWNSTPGMVSDVQSWLDNPASNFGWLLLGDESTASTAREFFTREASDSASRPALVVTYTPPSVATASQLLVTTATNVVAGAPFDITITAVDSNGNIVPGYTGTVAFSSSDPFPGTVPATYTFTAADQGTHTFAAGGTLFTAGSQTVTAQDTANPSISSTATITVTAAPAKTLLVTG